MLADDNIAHLYEAVKRSQYKRKIDGCIFANSRWFEVTTAADDAFADEREEGEIIERAQMYFIRVRNTEMVKIGFTTNIEQRMIKMDVANSKELVLEFEFLTAKFENYKTMLYTYLKSEGKHVRDGWFDLDDNTDYFALMRKSCRV